MQPSKKRSSAEILEKKPAAGKRSSTLFFAGLAAAVIVALLILWFVDSGQRDAELQPLIGRWERINDRAGEEKTVEVGKVNPDGSAEVRYFNPKPINVGKARASMVDNFPSLFIELPDAGYEGSTYSLTYEPSTDQLVGVYFQANEQRAYDVAFQRKSKEAK
jgi:hypothetical protein